MLETRRRKQATNQPHRAIVRNEHVNGNVCKMEEHRKNETAMCTDVARGQMAIRFSRSLLVTPKRQGYPLPNTSCGT